MRCLYCGNELALFKKLTRGGEFCSEAHRHRYQEEYNRLALSRLLQVEKPTAERPRPLVTTTGQKLETPPHPVAASSPDFPGGERVPEGDTHAFASQTSVLAEPPDTAPAVAPVARDPAELAGPIAQQPHPAAYEVAATPIADLSLLSTADPSFPQAKLGEQGGTLTLAGQVATIVTRVLDHAARPREGRLELREFTRAIPRVHMRLEATEPYGWESPSQPLDAATLPYPPGTPPQAWRTPERTFAIELSFGSWARLDFPSTGIELPSQTGEPEIVELPRPAPPAKPSVAGVVVVLPEEELDALETGAATPAAPPAWYATRTPAQPAHPPVAVEAPPDELLSPVDGQPASLPPPDTPPGHEPASARPTLPLPVLLNGIAPGKAKAAQVYQSVPVTTFRILLPRVSALPLRPLMALGPAPGEASQASQVQSPYAVGTPKIEPAPIEPGREEPVKVKKDAAPAPPETKPAPSRGSSTGRDGSSGAQPLPMVASAPPAAESARPAAPETGIRPDSELRGSFLDAPHLELRASETLWSRLPKMLRLSAVAALLAAVILGGYIGWNNLRGAGSPAATSVTYVRGGPMLADESGWSADWTSEAAGSDQARIFSVYRPSLTLANYRLEFKGQIENRSLGWVVRASSPQNYYAMALEITRPGLSPVVELARYAVIQGEETPRVRRPLPFPVHLDTVYKIRVDVKGSTLTTYVQDQKIDEWTDDRLKTGGVGLDNGEGERARIRQVILTPFVANVAKR